MLAEPFPTIPATNAAHAGPSAVTTTAELLAMIPEEYKGDPLPYLREYRTYLRAVRQAEAGTAQESDALHQAVLATMEADVDAAIAELERGGDVVGWMN